MAKLMIDIYDIYYKKNQNEEYRIFVLQNDEMYVPGFNSRDGFILEKCDYNINFKKRNKTNKSVEASFSIKELYVCQQVLCGNKEFSEDLTKGEQTLILTLKTLYPSAHKIREK